MAGVLIINAREDAAPAQALAEKLGALGLQTAFNLHGEHLRDAALLAEVVIALWSPHSYFRNELIEAAALSRDQNRLVHARMQNTPLPNAFERESSIDLTGWRGEETFQPWRHLLNAISGVLYAPPQDEDDDAHFVMQDYQEGDYEERAREYVATGAAYDQSGEEEAPLSGFPTARPAPQTPPQAAPQPQPQPPLRTPPAPGQATARVAAPAPQIDPAPMRPAPAGPAAASPAQGPLQPAATPRFTPSFPPASDPAAPARPPPNVLPNILADAEKRPGAPDFPPFPPPASGAPNPKSAATRHPVTPLSTYTQSGSSYQRPSGFAEPQRRGGGPSIIRLLIIGLVTFGVVAGAGIGGYMYLQRSENTGAATAWDAVDKTDPYALRQFLDSGEAGPYREPAQATLDTLALDRLRSAREIDTIEALQAFLVEFPDSRFAPQVNGRIAELREISGGGRSGAAPRESLEALREPQPLPPPPPGLRADLERARAAANPADEPYSPTQYGQPGVYSGPSTYSPPPSPGQAGQAGGPLALTPPGARDTPASVEDELRRQLSAPPPQQGPRQ